jgi:hypothetical protein
VAELAVLDQAIGEALAARRVVEELQRARTGGDAPEETEVVGDRPAGWIGHEPEIDPSGVGRDFCVGLDRATGCNCGTHQLLSELVKARSHPGEQGEHGVRPEAGAASGAARRTRAHPPTLAGVVQVEEHD